MNYHIIYHKGCSDGLLAAAIVGHYFREYADAISYSPMHYGDPLPDMALSDGATVYLVDFSLPPQQLATLGDAAYSVLVLDHHISAISKLDGFSHPNVSLRMDTRYSGAMLAWREFYPDKTAPLAVQWVQDRDLWQWKLPGSRGFSFASRLKLGSENPEAWEPLLTDDGERIADNLSAMGDAMGEFNDNCVAGIARNAAAMTLLGHAGHVVNCSPVFTSDVGHTITKQHGGFALMWCLQGDEVRCSLRSEGDFNVAVMAEHFDGGGHKNAAGFTVSPAELMSLLGAK